MINSHGISGMKNDPNPFRHNVLLQTKWQQEKKSDLSGYRFPFDGRKTD
jgi:hypothetical protein